MYVILSFLLSIITCYIGIKEMKLYENISSKTRKWIYLYPFLMIILFYRIGLSFFFVFFGAITPLLISHFIIDLKEQELPDFTNLVISIFAIIRLLAILIQNGLSLKILQYLLLYLATGIILFCVYLFLATITGGALGGGDIKLVGALGLFFHISMLPQLLLYPMILGSLIAILLLLSKKAKKDSQFAFGPAILTTFYLIAII